MRPHVAKNFRIINNSSMVRRLVIMNFAVGPKRSLLMAVAALLTTSALFGQLQTLTPGPENPGPQMNPANKPSGTGGAGQ